MQFVVPITGKNKTSVNVVGSKLMSKAGVIIVSTVATKPVLFWDATYHTRPRNC
jgi:hypothetical protein